VGEPVDECLIAWPSACRACRQRVLDRADLCGEGGAELPSEVDDHMGELAGEDGASRADGVGHGSHPAIEGFGKHLFGVEFTLLRFLAQRVLEFELSGLALAFLP